MFVLFVLARKALWVDRLIFETWVGCGGGGGEGWKNWFVQDFFFLIGQCFFLL